MSVYVKKCVENICVSVVQYMSAYSEAIECVIIKFHECVLV